MIGFAPAPDTRKKVRILELDLDRLSLSQVIELCARFVEERAPRHVVTANLQFMSLARKDRDFASLVERADVVVSDGMPIKWLSRLAGAPISDRITGHDLLQKVAALASGKGYSLYLLGGAPGAAAEAAERLRARFPGLRVAGDTGGRFSAHGDPEDPDALFSRIAAFRPDFLFAALGCPKQEYFISKHMRHYGAPVSVGVGCAFEVLTGRYKRAPRWMQACSLEWLFRLLQEPGRLWKRYLLADLPTTLRATWSILARRVSSAG